MTSSTSGPDLRKAGDVAARLRERFNEMTVFKDLRRNSAFSALNLPSFTRDWLLQRFSDAEGRVDAERLREFARAHIPRTEEWTAVKGRIVKDYERVKILAKIAADVDVRTGEASFSLPDYGLSARDTVVEDDVWSSCRGSLFSGRETWGMLELDYRPPDESARPRIPGRIRLRAYRDFRPYEVNVDHYREARRSFSLDEWLDVLLGAADYNAAGFATQEAKLHMLSRLLPFAEKRLNLVELAPKGTGKSYLFGRVSRFGWLSSGGVMSRARMFHDLSRRTDGLVCGNDFVVLDEVQTISFTDTDEMRAALKGYMESGMFTVGGHEGRAEAGIVLCGNISREIMDRDGYVNMFGELPAIFHESALIDRFHGFIRGWEIPRMHDGMKISGWALNSEYFCSILHELRSDPSYRAAVDELVRVPERADTRDTEAVKRLATAWLKLLFPHVRRPEDIGAREFRRFCLDRAMEMRGIILRQLGILDSEYRRKDMPALTVAAS